MNGRINLSNVVLSHVIKKFRASKKGTIWAAIFLLF